MRTNASVAAIPLTNHARTRMQQRCIRQEAVDYVLGYGRQLHDHRGCTVHYLDHRARRDIEKEQGVDVLRRLGKRLDTYVVVDGTGQVLTVGHRVKRLVRY